MAFHPTRYFCFRSFQAGASEINVLDLTSDIVEPMESDGFKENVKQAKAQAKSAGAPHYLSVGRTGFWKPHYVATFPSLQARATIKPARSGGETSISFDSHPPREVVMRRRGTFSNDEVFTLDGVPYRWSLDSRWHTSRMTLYKASSHGHEIICAKLVQSWRMTKNGALVAVDTSALDELTALLTALVVLHKAKQQKNGSCGGSDWSFGDGGGGGGSSGGGGGDGGGGGGD